MASWDVASVVPLRLCRPLRKALEAAVPRNLGNRLSVSLQETGYYEDTRHSATLLVNGEMDLEPVVGPFVFNGNRSDYYGLSVSARIILTMDLDAEEPVTEWRVDMRFTQVGLFASMVVS